MLPRRGLGVLTRGVYLGTSALVPCGMRQLAPLLAALVMVACAPAEEAGLCEGLPSETVDLAVAVRYEDVPLADGDTVPVFVPPQGGIATEFDISLLGVGLDTVDELRLEILRTSSGASVAAVAYSGGGLPLECVQDGELRVRAVPVPFADGLTLEALEGAEAQVVGTLVRTDGAEAEFVSRVLLDSTSYCARLCGACQGCGTGA